MTHPQRGAVDLDRTDLEPAPPPAAGAVDRPPPGPATGRSLGGVLEALGPLRFVVYGLVVIGLLAQMAAGMITAAREQSPTTDEVAYVAAATIYLKEHSLEYNFEHPPLAKLLMTAGLANTHIDVGDHAGLSQWTLGPQILFQEGNDAQQMIYLARLPLIILTLLFGLVVFAFARDLVGPVGGLVALALYSFSPDVIGYGSLAGVDMPATGFLVTSLWLAWRARRHPYVYLPLCGLALGAALASKMNTLPAVPLIMALAALSVRHAWRTCRPAGGAYVRFLLAGLGAAVGVAAVAFLGIWAVYFAVDPRLRWTSPPGLPAVPGLMGYVVDLLPVPRPYRDGMRVQLGYEHQVFGGFLFGERYVGARWYYLPAALLVKEPLGMLALWPLGIGAMVAVRRVRVAAWYVLLPCAAMLAVAMSGARDFGVRYAIFVPVLLAVAAGCVVAYRWRWVQLLALPLLVFVAISSLRTFPYYLPYSNEAFGGPSKTYLHLGDSNVDWGQDMARLATYLNEHYPGEQVWLVYKGRDLPDYYGIDAVGPLNKPPEKVHGLLAVSVSRLPGADGTMRELLAGSTKIADIGHSIFVYRR